MDESVPAVATEIDRYLRTGEADPYHAAWPGGFLDRAERASAHLRGALVQEVRRLSKTGNRVPRMPEGDTAALTRRKVAPMVRGLFPSAEQEVVLAALENSVVFLTPETIEPLLLTHAYDGSAWDLANLYLASLGAELLAENAPCLAGMSENMTCFVSAEYFAQEARMPTSWSMKPRTSSTIASGAHWASDRLTRGRGSSTSSSASARRSPMPARPTPG